MEFLFQNRGAGKRQVKPSQDIALLEDQLGAESSDDSEYKLESDDGEHDSNESHGPFVGVGEVFGIFEKQRWM